MGSLKLKVETLFDCCLVWTFCVYPTALFLHRRFIFDNRSTGTEERSLFDFINSVAMCLAEFR